MADLGIETLSDLNLNVAAFHITLKEPCKPSDVWEQFIASTIYPEKLYFSSNGRIEEIPDEKYSTQSTEMYATEDSTNSNKTATYIAVFDSFAKKNYAIFYFTLFILQQFKELNQELEEQEEVQAEDMPVNSSKVPKVEMLVTSDYSNHPKFIRLALEEKTGFAWSVKKATDIPWSRIGSSKSDGCTTLNDQDKGQNQTQNPQNNLNGQHIDYISSNVRLGTDPSSVLENQFILTTSLETKSPNILYAIVLRAASYTNNLCRFIDLLKRWIIVYYIFLYLMPTFSLLYLYNTELAVAIMEKCVDFVIFFTTR